MWMIAGEPATLHVEFMVDGQYVIPDEGSIKAILRDNGGEAFPEWNPADIPDVTTPWTTIVVSAEENTMVEEASFEARYLTVSFTTNGKPSKLNVLYRVAPFIPMVATCENVRSLLGVNAQELPDSDIDLYEAYFTLLSEQALIGDAMLRSDRASMSANKAVQLQAAIAQLPALPAKMLRSEKQDTSEYARMRVDFESLRGALEHQLAYELLTMEQVMTGTYSLATNPLMVLSSPADPFTN